MVPIPFFFSNPNIRVAKNLYAYGAKDLKRTLDLLNTRVPTGGAKYSICPLVISVAKIYMQCKVLETYCRPSPTGGAKYSICPDWPGLVSCWTMATESDDGRTASKINLSILSGFVATPAYFWYKFRPKIRPDWFTHIVGGTKPHCCQASYIETVLLQVRIIAYQFRLT